MTWRRGGPARLVSTRREGETTTFNVTGSSDPVPVAGSGAEALEMLARGDGPIDLLVTDVIMPHMFGKELAERVRGHHPSTRVLFMSGYAQPIPSSQGTLDPGVVLIEKPFTAEQLIRKVRQVIDETLTP